jgi:hypothetical protein
MDCLVALAPELTTEYVDRSTVSALWAICHLGRAWGIEAEGMLRRNDLIAKDDLQRLASWLDCISYATMMLLDGAALEEALEPYRAL